MLGFTAVKLHLLLLQWRVCFSGSLGKSLLSLLLFLVVANSRGSKAKRWRRSIPRKAMRWTTMHSLLRLLPSLSSRTPRRRKMKRRMRIWYDVFLCLACLIAMQLCWLFYALRRLRHSSSLPAFPIQEVFFAAADSPQTLIETCAVSGRSGTLVSSLLL